MAEPLSTATTIVGVISAASAVADKISAFVKREELLKLPGIADQVRRLELQKVLFKAVSLDIPASLPGAQDQSIAWILTLIHEKLHTLSDMLFLEGRSGVKRLQPLFETKFKEKLEREIDGLAENVSFLYSLSHRYTLYNMLGEVNEMKSLYENVVRFSLQSSQIFDSIKHQLEDLRSDFAGAFNLSINSDEDGETSKQRHEALESVKLKLYDQLDRLKRPSLVFPFNLVSQGSHATDELPTRRVKLDTGAHDNWIESSVLERWGVRYEPTNDQKTYVGAGGAPFEALGQVTLFWYSINQTKTKESVFLVHDDLPFDAILGSSYIMTEPMDTFAEGVFPLLHIMPKDELGSLRDTVAERGIDSEGIKKIQRAQKARAREENRQMKAASRATTRAGTPGFATPRAGLLHPTMSHAGTSRTTLLSNTPQSGATPQGSGTSTPAATDNPSVEDAGLLGDD